MNIWCPQAISKAQELARIEIVERNCFVDEPHGITKAVHELAFKFEAKVPALGVDVEEEVAVGLAPTTARKGAFWPSKYILELMI